MSFANESKINKLLRGWPAGTVYLSSWLADNGISSQLLNRHKKSNRIEAVGRGAVIRAGDKVDYLGGLYAIQTQGGLSIHVAGRTAMALLGRAHYVDLAAGRAVLMGSAKERLPLWFKKKDWDVQIDYYATAFLPPDMGMMTFWRHNYSVKVSSLPRAIMECLYLAPKHQKLIECYELMEGMNDLRPGAVQELLESCSSVKVKRLFLYLAEKFEHPWLEFFDFSKIDLGSGKRNLVKNGVYIEKYKITVPKEFERNEQPEI